MSNLNGPNGSSFKNQLKGQAQDALTMIVSLLVFALVEHVRMRLEANRKRNESELEEREKRRKQQNDKDAEDDKDKDE